jgi:hypothetical protein
LKKVFQTNVVRIEVVAPNTVVIFCNLITQFIIPRPQRHVQ